MKKLLFLLAIFSASCWAQCPQGYTLIGGSCVASPTAPFPTASNAGTDVICALHADVITGLPCNNAVTDGTTETAFATTTTIPANALSSSATPITLNLGALFTATTPTIVIRVRLGGLAGTIVYQTIAATVNIGARSGTMNCIVTVTGSSSSSPAILSCGATNFLGNSGTGNSLITNTALSVSINPTIAQALTVTVQFSAATTQNAIWLYSISSTPAGGAAGAGGLLTAQTTLSAAQINAMFTSPVLLIPAQGAGTIISPVKCIFNAVFGSAAFTGGGNLGVFYGPTSPPTAANQAVASLTSTLLTSFSSNQIGATNPLIAGVTTYINAGLYVSNQTGVFASGTGSTMTVSCQYSVLTGMQ